MVEIVVVNFPNLQRDLDFHVIKLISRPQISIHTDFLQDTLE